MSGTPSAEALGHAALERVALRARTTARADAGALLLREDASLLLVAGDCGLEEVAGCVLDAERPVVIRDGGVAAGVPVRLAGAIRGALCVRSADRSAIDESHLE